MFRKILFAVLLAAIGVGTISCGSSSDTVFDTPAQIPASDFSGSSFAYDTLIAYDIGKYKEIQTFSVGDTIYCGNLNLSWDIKKVYFASGSGYGHQPFMFYLHLTSAESPMDNEQIIVTNDTYILMSNGKLKNCSRLIPGDQVQGVDGTLYTVNEIVVGSYDGGVRGIGTEEGCYLIDVNGIVFSHYGNIPYGLLPIDSE